MRQSRGQTKEKIIKISHESLFVGNFFTSLGTLILRVFPEGDRSMEIIEAISDTNIGGAGVLLLTRLSADEKMRRRTLVMLPKGSALRERLLAIGVAVAETTYCADRSFDIRAIPEYIRLIRKNKPHTVNCHGCLSFRIASFICGVPVRIYTRHCTFPRRWWQGFRILRALTGRAQTLLSNGIIAVAEAAREDLEAMGVPRDKVCVIINGVSGINLFDENERAAIRKTLNIPSDALVVSIFARLEEYKGHTDLINAAQILLERSDRYRFLIVGSGSFENELKALCEDKNISERFIFTGFAPDVAPYMNITDINVNCSHGTETSSLALSEGMSIGLVSVVSDYGGNTYMVKDGENGFVYPVFDAEKLARIIENIANDGALRERLSHNARLRFENELNAKKMTEETYDYYTALRSFKISVRSESP